MTVFEEIEISMTSASSAAHQCQAQECVLYGSVLDTQRDFLMQRLKGLCDPGVVDYYEQEMVFSLSRLYCSIDLTWILSI
jgi:hypothetical protein